MIIGLLSLSPEILLLLSLLMMLLVNKYRETVTPKTFYTVSKIFMLLVVAAVLFFYNLSGFPKWWVNNTYTSLFKICTLLFAFAWFFLSCKWFLNKNRSSLGYYMLGTASLLMLMLMISSQNLGLMLLALSGSFVLNYLMIGLNETDFEVKLPARRYLIAALCYALMFAIGLIMIYVKVGSLDYELVAEYLGELPKIGWYEVVFYMLIMAPLLFMIGLAPFHFWFADILGVCILPVCGFLTLIPVFAAYSALVDLGLNVFYPLLIYFKMALPVFAVLSLAIGAVSANREDNLRLLFAYSGLYHLGFIFMTLVPFNYSSLSASFVYLLFYVSSMMGIYTVFFSFKSNGEYLLKLKEISGIFTQRSFVSVAILVFMVSLVGSPPMLGFFGKLLAINSMIIEGSYWSVAIIISTLLLLVNAYLNVIKAVFFDERKKSFDRVDKGIYICLFINVVVVVIAILNPGRVLDYLEKLLSAVL